MSDFNYNILSAKITRTDGGSKARPARIFALSFADQVMDAREEISRVLQQAKLEGLFTPKELKEIFGKDISTVYRYLSGELKITSDIMTVLIRELAGRGHTELLSLMLPQGFTVVKLPDHEAKRSIKDEFIRAVKEEALAVHHFEKSEYRKAANCAGKAVTETLAMVGQAEEILLKRK